MRMKIMSLNVWGGRAGDITIEYIKEQKDVDVFCLQEVFNGGEDDLLEISEDVEGKQFDFYSQLVEALPEHRGFFAPCLGHYYGLAIFVRNGLDVSPMNVSTAHICADKSILSTDSLGHHCRIVQILEVEGVTIANFHGLWNGKGKGDSPERVAQSQNIVKALEGRENVVLIGDYNLAPDTESIKILEDSGLVNLITKHGITSTRPPIYTKLMRYADYALISEGMDYKNFEVRQDEVSDHLPLVLEL
jgi:exonuclease III